MSNVVSYRLNEKFKHVIASFILLIKLMIIIFNLFIHKSFILYFVFLGNCTSKPDCSSYLVYILDD